jgi:diguanylate cyclase (GGDEF)-like protein/putative nucleotidyltransferase with HDIG domain
VRRSDVADLKLKLEEAHRRVAALEGELRTCRSKDALTGLIVQASLIRRLDVEIERVRRHARPLTVVVLDIDGMRALNAHYGRAVADDVLKAVAKTLTGFTRASDAVTRSGADEFALMLPETDAASAVQALERIMLELEALRVGRVESVSVSAGVAQWERPLTGEQLLDRAATRAAAAHSLGGGRIEHGDAPPADAAVGRAHGDVVAALAEALLERDRYTGEHSESVVELAESVARGLALGDAEVDVVKAAALLHDIGKVAIPDHILNKPTSLDEHEWSVMRDHPVIGERILRSIPGLGAIARVVRHEHERVDGSGYPDGIVGDQIPIGARIILACDAYHAMTSDRPYRKAMSHADAIRELAAGAGTQFDPKVTEVLIGALYGRQRSAVGAMNPAASAA